MQSDDQGPVRRTFVRNLAEVVVRPRLTMRRILDRGGDRGFVPLVILAVIAGSLGDFDPRPIIHARGAISPWLLGLINAGALLLLGLVAVGVIYLLAWIARFVGRLFEGTAEIRDVRSALAWGLAPVVWSLFYRIPVVISRGLRDDGIARVRIGDELIFAPGMLTQGCAAALWIVVVELGLIVWYLFVASNTLAEAEGFSAWRGLGTVLATLASPAVIAAAALFTALT